MTENELRTKSNLYNQVTQEKQYIHEYYNSVANYQTIIEAIKSDRAKDLSDGEKHEGEKCLVIGSGPSLDEALPLLKDWKGGIICTTSHATTLLYHGRVPDYILALDPFARWKEIDGIDWSQYDTKLILCPTVWPDLVKNWPNEMLLYRQDLAGKSSFYNKELNHSYSNRVNIEGAGERDYEFRPYIKTQMTLFSCSPPAQLFAADCMKYDTVYLVGCDFAYNTEKTRFTAWFKYTGKWVKHESKYEPQEGDFEDIASNAKVRDVTTNNGLLATPQQLFYKKNMFSAMRLSMQNVIICGKGSITELPNITAKDMIRKQDFKAPVIKDSKRKQILEKYLASVYAFVIITKQGKQEAYSFIESENPDYEIPDFMANMAQLYNCSTCGAELKSNDYTHPAEYVQALEKEWQENGGKKTEKLKQLRAELVEEMTKRIERIQDHTGDECPQCKKGKLVKKIDIDIKANMNRIRRLVLWM